MNAKIKKKIIDTDHKESAPIKHIIDISSWNMYTQNCKKKMKNYLILFH